ncbi:MAG: hypothetical protein FWC53_02860 [Firmicutes bacterium]|nr:hypothetical protein [Bacillota bacterium]
MDFENGECPVVKVDGFIEKGTQFELEINLSEDRRNVVFGILKDCFNEPVEDAVVKLIEIEHDERKPVSHTFTNKEGEFVFGPLCPDRVYEILFWVNKVKHVKICEETSHVGTCLRGVHLECNDVEDEHECEEECE